jgi:hypothetical protein
MNYKTIRKNDTAHIKVEKSSKENPNDSKTEDIFYN